MTPITIASVVLSKGASAGAGKIVHQIIKNNVTPNSTRETIAVALGATALAALAADAAGDHMRQSVAQVGEAISKIKNRKNTVPAPTAD